MYIVPKYRGYQYFRELLFDYPEWQIGNMIYILHSEYGKPDKRGIITDL